jgi:hypothetical protein
MKAWATALLLLLACSCTDGRTARERKQLARFPLGDIVEDCDTPQRNDRGLPEGLQLLAPVLGRGVCVSLDIARPDGARDSPRWGLWTYEYVRAEQKPAPDGIVHTYFTSIEASSLGLEARGEYARDVFAGEWRFWYPNGKPRAVGSFNEGKLSGEWKFWLADGSIDEQRSGTYSEGVRARDPALR